MSEDDYSNRVSTENPRLRRYGPSIVFISGLILLFVNSFLPDVITINHWSILLLVLLMVIPFMSDVKELIVTPDEGIRIIKTAGELRDQVESSKENALEKLRSRIEELEREEEQEEVEDEISSRINQVRTEIREIAQTQSPDLAFLELVRRLERELRDILLEEGITKADRAGFGELIQLAREHEVLDRDLIINLEDIRPIRNQVAHGGEVDPDEADQMIELGIDIYETILYDIETSDITEHAIQDAILRNPDLIEEGFEPLETEKQTDYGAIDILGEDRQGNKVIVEIKSYEADMNHLKQLTGFVENQKQNLGDDLRGVLIAPSIRKEVGDLEDSTVSVKELDLRRLRDFEIERE